MVKWTLTNIIGVLDTFAWNSNGTGKFGAIALRNVMSTEHPELVDTLCRLEGTIKNSTQDASRNWFAELEMAMIDNATDKAIAKVSMQASKDIKCDFWAINNVSVSKTTNPLTNLQQTKEGFGSTLLSVEDVIVTGTKKIFHSSGERVAVSLSDSESADLLGTAFEAISGIEAKLGDTKTFRARIGEIEGPSYLRLGNSQVNYKGKLSTGEPIIVMDSNHTSKVGSSLLAKYRTIESQGCATSTYLPQNYGLGTFTFNTIAFNPDEKSCAFVKHTVQPSKTINTVQSSETTIRGKIMSYNTEVSSQGAQKTAKNPGVYYWGDSGE